MLNNYKDDHLLTLYYWEQRKGQVIQKVVANVITFNMGYNFLTTLHNGYFTSHKIEGEIIKLKVVKNRKRIR